MLPRLRKPSRSVPALFLTVALTAIGAVTATPAQAAACDGYVHNSANSANYLYVTPEAEPEVRLGNAQTWYGDHPVSWVAIRTINTALIRYEDAAGTHLRTDRVGRGTYIINPCHRAFVKTPA